MYLRINTSEKAPQPQAGRIIVSRGAHLVSNSAVQLPLAMISSFRRQGCTQRQRLAARPQTEGQGDAALDSRSFLFDR